MRVQTFLTVLAVFSSFYPPPASAEDSCGQAEKKTAVYQAYDTCQKILSAQGPAEASALIKKLGDLGYCQVSSLSTSEEQKPICKDPAEFACQSQGNLFDSRCRMGLTSPRDIVATPPWVQVDCEVQKKEQEFVTAHAKECGVIGSIPCPDQIFIKHEQEYLKIERDAVYTPAHIARLQSLFDRVKKEYISLVTASHLIPASRKALLLEKLRDTVLALPSDLKEANCFNSNGVGASSSIYNDSDGKKKIKHVFICIGTVAMLDDLNPYNLMETIGHEITHSIDPCTLEQDAYSKGRANAHISDEIYPGLISCLRGGTGENACDGGILNCNTAKGIEEACVEGGGVHARKDYIDCVNEAKAEPHCDLGKSDPHLYADDLSDYRKDSEPVDQSGESVADFFGADVLGHLVEEDKSRGILTERDQVDILASIAADHVKLHGRCLTKNTHDEHPAGSIRIDRIIMGDKSFRHAVCGESIGPPQNPFSNTTCPGL